MTLLTLRTLLTLPTLSTLPARRDVAVAAAAMLVDVLLFGDLMVAPNVLVERSSPAIVLLFGVVAFAILIWRRCAPVTVFGLLCIHATLGSLLLTYRPVVFVCVALGTVAAHERGRLSIGAFVVGLLTSGAWLANEARTSSEFTPASTLVVIGIGYAVILIAVTAGGRRYYLAHRREGQLEDFHREEARKAIESERLRVARELHDIVAHAITLMMLHASAARAVMRDDVDGAASALATVEQSGRQAMNELRRLLGVMRAGEQLDDHSALVDTGDLESLIEDFRTAGLSISANLPDVVSVDRSVELAIYRVVQESLTNVVKHAGANATARVHITQDDGKLNVTVQDTGTSKGASKGTESRSQNLSTGYGLVGLAERVALAGGKLTTGLLPSGGFGVQAAFLLSETLGAIDLTERTDLVEETAPPSNHLT